MCFEMGHSAGCLCGGSHAYVPAKKTENEKLRALLKRAADLLQSYEEEINGDMNNSLAMEIYEILGEK